jgi:hypothetical protein
MAGQVSDIALHREQEVFVIKETVAGTFVDPAGANAIFTISPATLDQPFELLEDQQYRNTRAEVPNILGRTQPGAFSLETYMKPSGTKGTGPAEDVLLDCLMGTKTATWSYTVDLTGITPLENDEFIILATITGPTTKYTDTFVADATPLLSEVVIGLSNASPSAGWTVTTNSTTTITITSTTSNFTVTCTKNAVDCGTITNGSKVEYSLNDNLDTFSLVKKSGHTLWFSRGNLMQKAEFGVQADKLATVKWDGQYIEQGYIGTDEIDTGGINDSATTLPITNDKLFYVPSGMAWYILVESEVMKVTAVGTGSLTVVRAQQTTSAAAHLAGVAITPWVPTAVDSGYVQHGKRGAVTVGGTSTLLMNAKIVVDQQAKFYDNEKNGVMTAESYGTPGKRKITLTASRYFRAPDAAAIKDAQLMTRAAVVLAIGTDAGKIIEFTAPAAQGLNPKFGGNPEIQQDLEWKLIAELNALDTGELLITAK